MLTLTTINGIDTEATRPPAVLYVASRERIRSGRGTLTLRCFDRAWTCYWGSMGGGATLGEFMSRVDAGYIANCLMRGNRGVITKRQAEDRDMAYLTRICETVKAALAQGAAA